MHDSLTYIVVLNWNGWKDTLACLNSIYSMSDENYKLIIVDNNSSDDSCERISDFLISDSRQWNRVSFSHKDNDFSFSFFADGGEGNFFVQSDKNVGYGAGNNIGIKLIKKIEAENFQNCCIWILNNDTCVHVDALSRLLENYASDIKRGLKVGLYGSVIKNYSNREEVLAYCGKFNKFTGAAAHVKDFEAGLSEKIFDDKEKYFVYYPIGASIFFDGSFVDAVGELCEEHFLYYEEVEWVLRGRIHGWSMRVVDDSFVFHKEGASTGGGELLVRSLISDFYILRSRVIMARKIGGIFEFCIIASTIFPVLKRAFSRRKGMLKNALLAIMSGFSVKIPCSWKI